MRAIAEKHTVFKRLHQSGCFVLPNPWGGESARLRERLGFVALASALWRSLRPERLRVDSGPS
jgi:2-methylisocitrate lyase-like PEP mutase family enzyme